MSLKIIGTSHIAKQSVQEIKKAILEEKADIVAVELDAHRATALLQNQKRKATLADIIHIGVKGYLFARMGQFAQQKLGKMVGMAPGADMKTAIETARQQKLPVLLIDQPLKITLKNFSSALSWTERWRFIADIVKGVISPKRQWKQLGLENFDLHKVPEQKLIEKMMAQLQQRYPSVYQTLVEDRNKYMVRRLVQAMRQHPEKKILAIVGAGHKKGMEELLLKVDVVR